MEKKKISLIVNKNQSLIAELRDHLSKKLLKRLSFLNAQFYVNNELKKSFEMVNIGDLLEIEYLEKEKPLIWKESSSPLRVLFENANYLVVNKEQNLLTIPTKACPNSLYQQLLSYLGCSDIHILNRLDRETSGLIVVAKNRFAASKLEPVHQHIVRKYLVCVEGIVEGKGRIENFIVKDKNSNKRLISNDKNLGKKAISNYKVLKNYADYSVLEFELETGRTHQIRAQVANMGHPIIGDVLYGAKKANTFGLISYYVMFVEPFTKETIQISLEV